MDTKNVTNLTSTDIGAFTMGKPVIAGAKQIRKAIRQGRVEQVILAKDADPAITDALEQLCSDCSIPCSWASAMAELGRLCEIEVGAAAAAILKNEF